MPRLIFAAKAVRDLDKIREYFAQFSNEAALKAAAVLIEGTVLLLVHPLLGKPLEEMPDYRELIRTFRAGSFTMRYRIEGEAIIVVAVKHSKEKALAMV